MIKGRSEPGRPLVFKPTMSCRAADQQQRVTLALSAEIIPAPYLSDEITSMYPSGSFSRNILAPHGMSIGSEPSVPP